MKKNQLRYWRDHAGLSQEQLGNRIGRHWQTVQRWEKGRARISEEDQEKLAALFGITTYELLLGPEYASAQLIPQPEGFHEDAAPYDPGQIEGLTLKLSDTEFLCEMKSDAVAASRERLQLGDLAIFDIGARAIADLQSDQIADGIIVMAQIYNDTTGDAETIVRQWAGPWPGVLHTNRPGQNQITTLALRDDIQIKGVLKRSLRQHARAQGKLQALPSPE